MQPESSRIVFARSDFPHPFQFRFFFFFKEGKDHIAKGPCQRHLIRKQVGVPESSGPVLWQDATGPLPVSHFQTRFRSFRNVPDNIVQNQPGSDLVLAECVGFGQRDPVRKQANVQESSGPLLAIASQSIRTGCDSESGMFTGVPHHATTRSRTLIAGLVDQPATNLHYSSSFVGFYVHRNHKAYQGRANGGGGRGRLHTYPSLRCLHQNDFCIKMGSDESRFSVSLIVRDKVTRQCPQTTILQ